MYNIFKIILPIFLLVIGLYENSFAQQETLIRQFLAENREKLGLTAADISDWTIYDQYQSKHNTVSHVYIRQRHQGIEVYNAIANFNIKDGKVLSIGDRLVRNLNTKINTQQAAISPDEAIRKAAKELNLTIISPIRALEPVSSQHLIFSNGGISKENIPVKLIYTPNPEGEVLLSWDLSIYENNAKHWWSVRVDAQNGNIIDKADWVISCNFPDGAFGKCNNPEHHHNTAPLNSSTTSSNNSSNAIPEQYRVFAEPFESPNHGPRTLEINPRDSTASPWGWHDTNGSAGAEFTITQGNNVHAYDDRDDDDLPGYSPDGTVALNFDFPLNLNQTAIGYQDAAITNLFYWNNLMHDMWYRYGFDEASGNFQQNNYSRGGLATDYVFAEAQDGGGTNNANFATPADGDNPRMQMYLWTGGGGVSNLLNVNSPAGIAGPKTAAQATFGPGLTTTPITANVVLAEDGTAPINDGCTPLVNPTNINGRIALVYRGACNFTVKVAEAQAAGAQAVIVINNVAGAPFAMGGTDPSITIPSIMISDVDGAAIVAQINGGQPVNATLADSSGSFDKDGDLDNGIIAHEYGHGISTRLTGGPANSNCLNNSEQMGEGWSDFFGLMMTIEAGDLGSDGRGIGTFATGEPITGGGIRNAPYTTNMSVNPYTYADVNNTADVSEPHGIGFVWCSMLWDLNWAMIDQYGFDPDFFGGNGGNNMTMQLVIDGLKLQPCSPGFTDGRDAILLADSILYGGANQCLIWDVFARRGLGFSANQGSSASRTDQTEAFDIPTICAIPTVPPVSNFNSSLVSSCRGTVNFTDQSTGTPQSWTWTFGDGNGSTARNPTHTYSNSGTYTVQLIVSNTLGIDTSTVSVIVSLPPLPTVSGVSICAGQTAELTGNATGDIVWYNSLGIAIDTVLTFNTPALTLSTTYFAENVIFFPSQNIGPLNGTIGAGGYHNTAFTGTQNFTASKALTILSAWLDAGSAGSRTLYLWSGSNGTGAVVDSITINVPAGAQRVALNLNVPGPGNYSLGGTTINLYRNTAGATFPYTIANLISITGTSAATPSWYYLYDWEVQEAACRSAQVPVVVNVDGAAYTYSTNIFDVQFTDISANATSWAWDFGDGNSSTAQNPLHSYATAGTYTVELIANGNTSCPYTQIITVSASGTVQIGNDFNAELSPNPSSISTVLRFNTALKEQVLLQIISVDGRILRETVVQAGESSKELDLKGFVPAMYLLRISGKSTVKTLKLTVK